MANINFRTDKDILYIALDGRIDASNAADVEQSINEIRNSHVGMHTVLDADTLEYIGDFMTSVGVRGLEYLPETNQYIAAGFNIEIMLLDENFNKISSHICADQTLMTQGRYSDGKYVYDPRYLDGSAVHLLVVEDMNGKLLASANLYGLSKAEPEHMFKLNGKYYIGCNHSGYLYEVEVIPQNWW
jgi:hypothetical protein